MIGGLSAEAVKHGLKLHMGKTVVMTNEMTGRPSHLNCGGCEVKVVNPSDAERYLGRTLCTGDYHDTDTARRADGRWTFKLLSWVPWFRITASRHVGRPNMRWDDAIARLAAGDWIHEALDEKYVEVISRWVHH